MTELTLFTFIGETITNATNAFMVPAANELMLKLQMAVLAGVTLYIVMSGYAVATGSMESPFWTVMKQWAKILFIAYFAFTVDGYHEQVVGTLSGIETGLSDVLKISSPGAPPSTIYQTLDEVVNKGAQLASIALQQASDAGWNIGAAASWFITGIFISIGTLIFAIVGGVNIIVAKFSLAVMFALGPFFIACAMFPMTSQFFDRWLSQVMNYIFTIVVLALIMSFGIVAFDGFISGVDLTGEGVQNPYIAGLQVFGLTLILSWVAMQAGNMASGLAGGVSTSALSLRQIASGAMSPARAVGAAHNVVNPTATRLDPRTGHQTTARRAEHLAMGRSVWARNPAYREAIKERLASAWAKQPGGDVKGK